jgi:hypothetical protein
MVILLPLLILLTVVLIKVQMNFVRDAQFRIGFYMSELLMLEIAPERKQLLISPQHWTNRTDESVCGTLTRDCVVLEVAPELETNTLRDALKRICAQKYSHHRGYKYFGCYHSQAPINIHFEYKNSAS